MSSKYTNLGKSQVNGWSRPFQGWAEEGNLHVNQLYLFVERNDHRMQAAFEQELMVAFFLSELEGNQESSELEEVDGIYHLSSQQAK